MERLGLCGAGSGAGAAVNPLWRGGGIACGELGSHKISQGVWEPQESWQSNLLYGNQAEMFLRWKISSLFLWHIMSTWLVFKPEEEHTLKVSACKKHILSDLWLFFFFLRGGGVGNDAKGPKRSISQLHACSSLWKHCCFLKLSQSEAFKGFLKDCRPLCAWALTKKVPQGPVGCKRGYCISWSSQKGLAASSAIPSGKV